jgi:hypothetical protein
VGAGKGVNEEGTYASSHTSDVFVSNLIRSSLTVTSAYVVR